MIDDEELGIIDFLDDSEFDMVDAEIDDQEDAEFELEACTNEGDMALVDAEVDKKECIPGFLVSIDDDEELVVDDDPYEGINLF